MCYPKDDLAAGAGQGAPARDGLERFPTGWNHPVDKNLLFFQRSEACSHRKNLSTFSENALARLLSFRSDARGATAVEFAFVAPFLFLTILFILSIGYMIFMNQTLDYATQKAARQIRTGQAQSAAITSSAAFAARAVCPFLPTMFNCNNVIVYTHDWPSNVSSSGSYPYNVYTPFIDGSNTGLVVPPLSTNNTFCPGGGSQYVFLEILYPVPFFMSFLSSSTIATTYNGQKYYMITSTAVFLNEPFSTTAAC
jgi:Flp pilus assembly protein TadG